ncbi:MAG: bifunctional aldolase/short-chain dehydrogenase [Gammaproteobacteria bacterium]|nr:bifunctional aldolase/short-chain dehydrogenase [Gammaproteobacteria bacterium]
MLNRWNNQEAAAFTSPLALRVYTSRLLGLDPSLVLHGGGNTSVKETVRNILGNHEEILYVKGSGWDLETIEEAGFPAANLDHLIALARLPALGDMQMVNELRTHMTKASAPTPSVEAILHAVIPHKYVDHTHADAIIAITNTAKGRERIAEVFGDDVVVIPYVMPGFDLARLCGERFSAESTSKTIGMVLMNHGIFSFGQTAKESYERMIELVSRAENYLKGQRAWDLPDPSPRRAATGAALRLDIATLRRDASRAAGFPLLLVCHRDDRSLDFAQRPDLATLTQQGPATPDHVIRTKRIPLLGRDVEAYVAAYKRYFDEHAPQARDKKTMLDPAPRVILDPEFGVCALGRSAKDAGIVADIYGHTIEILLRAHVLGGYQALPARDIFDVEYWDLEQAKLKSAGAPPPFAGEVALITGAASGIGKACAEHFLKQGAAVIGLDIDAGVESASRHAAYLGLTCDVTQEDQLAAALETAVRRFGGLDMLVLNAGIFPASRRLDSLDSREWRRVFDINLDANLNLLRETHPLLKLSPRGGRVVIIGSKNVMAPGPGVAAYSSSKAALTQLARVAALEWGEDGIRVNSIHPDAVFDTAIWTDEVLQARAKNYGLTVENYKRKNILKTEIQSRDVADMAIAMCGPLFAKTTGAQVPLDGGNDRVI